MKEMLVGSFLFWSPFCLVTVRVDALTLVARNLSSSATKQQGRGILKGDVPWQEVKGQCHVATNLNCNKEQL